MDELNEAINAVLLQSQSYCLDKDTDETKYIDALLECISVLRWMQEHNSKLYEVTIRLMKLRE